MARIKRILVAIKSPSSRGQVPMHKAAMLARGADAKLLLFHAITQPLLMDAWAISGQTFEEVQDSWKATAMEQLEKLAKELRETGLKVECDCAWDFPAYEAVVRSALKKKADLIVAERTESRRLMPWLLRFNDWELIRRSPVPVLLVKRYAPWRKASVLAAIDPLHMFAKPAKLDAAILDQAALVADALDSPLHVVHAYPDAPAALPLYGIPAEVGEPVEHRQPAIEARKAFERELTGRRIPMARRHLVPGRAMDVVPRMAKKLRAGIVVMGGVSRSGLKRLVIGNTAEQVLDTLVCDVLVLKPSEFKARVRERVRGPQLIASSPAYI
jgi:universal stress protein E